MRNIIRKIKKVVVVGASLLVGTVSYGQGTDFKTPPFINWGGNLYMSNNTSYTNGNANFIFRRNDLYTNVAALTAVAISTNQRPDGTSFTNSFTYPSAVVDAAVVSVDAIGQVAPFTLSVLMNDTNWVPNPSTQNLTNIVVPFSATSSSNTNTVTFYFSKIVVSTNSESYTNNWFIWNVTANGTTPVMQTTNLPSAFVQGAKGFRLEKIANSSAVNSPTILINQVWVSNNRP